MSRVNYQTANGVQLQFGPELGRGGEGAVFSIENSPNCAKIYHQPLDKDRAEKIRLMAAHRSPTLAKFSSWPIDLINTSSGQPAGLVMPRIEGMKDVHELYSPKSRRDKFERADWRFLIRASSNIARAFATIHDSGFVIGDVNHGSILVGQDARVSLVDTDSFQAVFSGKTYRCEKGVETYTPPELQSQSFARVIRTPDHDNFGLSVLIFHLLMMGRHPFAGRFSGAGEMTIPKAIAERRFAYGSSRAKLQMERPPGTPDLSILGAKVMSLLETAFTTTETGKRPGAITWIAALSELEKTLTQCKAAESHWHLSSLTNCPWCQMEKSTGVPLFSFVIQNSGGPGIDVQSLIKRMSELSALGPAPNISAPVLTPSQEVAEIRKERKKLQGASIILGIVLAAIGFALGSVFLALAGAGLALGLHKIIVMFDKSTIKYKGKAEQARKAWTTDQAQWERQASGKKFDDLRAAFLSAKKEWDRLPQVRIQRLDQLQKDRHRLQLEHYLDGFLIENATISGIGPGRKVALASEGIETAADIVEQKLFIPGFGPATRGKLLDWRKGLERSFVFDAARPVDRRHVAAVEQGILTERKSLELKLQDKATSAIQEHGRIQFLRKQMRQRIEASLQAHTQAEVDYKAIL